MGAPSTLYAFTPGADATTHRENGEQNTHVPQVNEEVGAVVQTTPTIHNWVELVYGAFGHAFPTEVNKLALLGLRTGRSLPTHVPGTPRDNRPKPPGLVEYGDQLFAAFTRQDLRDEQNVEVFECVIDVTKLWAPKERDADLDGAGERANAILHPNGLYIDDAVVARAEAEWEQVADLKLPDLLEGKRFTARPAPYLAPRYPGDVVLRVETDPRHPGARPEDVVAIAKREHAAWHTNTRQGGTKYHHWYPGSGSWCGMFVSYVMSEAGLPVVRYSWVPEAVAGFGSGAFGMWIPLGTDPPEPGDAIVYNVNLNTSPAGRYDHTGLAISEMIDDSVDAIDGNTSGTAGGSPSDGDCLERKSRHRSYIAGFGRPRWAPIIRWGGDATRADNHAKVGQTVLHHHCFLPDGQGGFQVDGKSRYKTGFLALVERSPKDHRKQIPYLVVSTQYVRTYSEWLQYLRDNKILESGPATPETVIKTAALRSPEGMTGQYLPSFLTEAEANHILDAEEKARTAPAPPHETQEEQAARWRRKRQLARKRRALESALFQLSFTPTR